MGQKLAAGVAIRIEIRKRHRMVKDDERFDKSREDIIEQIGKFIDLEHYNIENTDNCISFNIDLEYFNNNIHDAYLKFKETMDLSYDCYKLDKYFNLNNKNNLEFNKENFPITLTCDDKGQYKIDSEDDLYSNLVDWNPFTSNIWLFYGDVKNLFSMCKVYIDYVRIYTDIEKIFIEDDWNLLAALNILCNKTFKDGLAKNISFYISG